MTNRNVDDIYPLSAMQQGMLFHSLLAPDSEVYVEQTTAALRGSLDVAAFTQAWQRVLDRHPILRTAFVWEDVDEPLQVVQRRVTVPLEVQDWREVPERDVRFEALRREQRARGFDLSEAPLFRLTLIRMSEDEWQLIWTHHHTLLDGWSLPILLKEVFAFYEAFARGKPLVLPAVRPFRDYIAWLKRQDISAAESFWRMTLAGYTGPAPLPISRSVDQHDETESRYAEQETWLSAAATTQLQTFARTQRLTINTLVTAAWALLLARYSGSDDVVFGATVSGRPATLPGAEGMVGLFINTLPVHIRIAEEMSLGGWLQGVQSQQADLRQFEHTPLVQIQGWSDVPRDTPLFDSILVFENYPTDRALADQLAPRGDTGLRITGVHSYEQTNYPLTFVAGLGGVAGPALMLKLSYDGARFDEATIIAMLGHLRTLLEGMPDGEAKPVGKLPLLTAAEQQRILIEWNATTQPFNNPDLAVHQLFEAQARATPAALAVLAPGADTTALTYSELEARADRLARRLQALGAGPGALVAVLLERSPELIIALLGVLKAGAAYLPLDPTYPAERIALMLQDAGARLLVTQERLVEGLKLQVESLALEVVCLDGQERFTRLSADHPREPQLAQPATCNLQPDSLAYVIYTSGSTGTPKGVMVSHSALANHARALADVYAIVPGDRMLQFITPSFDAAGEEIYPTLIRGATLVLPGAEREQLGNPLAEFCERYAINYLHLVAPVWHQWCDDLTAAGRKLDLPLKLLLVGGESPDPARLSAWNRLLPQPCRFVNAYGPTEATITSTLFETRSDASLPAHFPIGRPIANAHVYVLDAQTRPQPAGVPGELYIGGAGIALGYLNRPDLTAERFVSIENYELGIMNSQLQIPSSGRRLYRTGDLVRWLPDGNLEFVGRADDQVKIRGFRVELGEIEAALSALPAVREAVVLAHDEATGKRLTAYVVPAEGNHVDTAALRTALAARLPDYMLPTGWTVLSGLLLTPTGKVDRRALAALSGGDETSATTQQAPRTPEEELIAGIFSALLGIQEVTANDNFFDLGGHSLLATRLSSRLHEVFGLELPLRTLFDAPTVTGLAAAVSAARDAGGSTAGAPAMSPLPRTTTGGISLPSEPPPLSFGQQRLWFLDQLEPGLLAYNTPAIVRLQGRLDADALQAALDEIVRRHEVLRTSFATQAGRPVQIIAPELHIPIRHIDLSAAPETRREDEALREIQADVLQPFDLGRGPVLRACLVRLAPDDHVAAITVHHIAADGWSLGVLIDELSTLYATFGKDDVGRDEGAGGARQNSPLQPLPLQYADYAAWQRAWLEGSGDDASSPLHDQLAYWREQLSGLPARLELPTDRPRPAVQSSNGSTYSFRLPKELSDDLLALARREGVTLYMALLAGYQTLLSRYSGQSDIAVGSVVASRAQRELEALIGFFVNTLVFRTQFGPGEEGPLTFSELLVRVRETALGAYAHQDVPFEVLVDALQPQRDLSHTPLFQAALSLQNVPMPVRELPGLTLRAVNIERGTAQFDMLLTFSQTPAGLAGAWEYNTDLFDESTIVRMAGHLQTLLAAAVADPSQPVSHLPLLTAAERQMLLGDWNATAAPFPADTTIHALIEAWVERTPAALAAEFCVPAAPGFTAEHQRLTYADLAARADQLAAQLVARGVGPDHLVGLCVERSLALVVGLLGILKAGAAFLPLDPHYPPDRLAFMLQDAGLRVLVTQPQLLATGTWLREASHWQPPAEPAPPQPGAGRPAAESGPPELVLLTLETTAPHGPAAAFPPPATGPENLAYAIYTSGSTGRPKAALLRHRGLCNLATVQQRTFDIQPGQRILQFAPLSFDAAVWETVMALANGATLVLTHQDVLASGPALLRLLQEQQVTTVTLPPSLLSVLTPGDLPALTTVIAAGERCTSAIVQQWAGGRRFFNAYGPTETTVCATIQPCEPPFTWPFGGPPIGGPLSNCQLYVVDPAGRPQPIGVPGELLIGGVGLATGYLNRPDLTAARFVPMENDELGMTHSHFPIPNSGARLYRTGDLVRWRPDGSLDFLGRLDDQVKVRGFRVELGEIETALRRHPAVQDAVVVLHQDTLVAYLIPQPDAAPAAADLRTALRTHLPEYMLPATCVPLAAFPLTPAGKVDRRALAARTPGELDARTTAAYVAPRTPTEATLAHLAADLLGRERVGVEDNFFELGGHSLLATQLLARIRDQFRVELPLKALFEGPTIAALAQALTHAQLAQTSEAAKVTEALNRIKGMSPEQVKALLAAKQAGSAASGKAGEP